MPMDRPLGVRGVSVMGVRGVPMRPSMGLPWVVRGLSVDRLSVAHGSPVGCPWAA